MAKEILGLILHDGQYAVARLEPDEAVPAWLAGAEEGITVVARTPSELSVTCLEEAVPDSIQAERGWRLIQVQGPLEFSQVGILASLVAPLAQAAVPVFAISTYETDYLLVKEVNLETALSVLAASGHRIS